MELADLNIPFFKAEKVILLHDKDYHYYALDRIHKSRRKILICQFIMSAEPDSDRHREVRGLCYSLTEAAWRGLDVRVLVSPFQASDPVYNVNRVATRFLTARNVRTREYLPRPGSRRDSMHSKFIIFDTEIVVLSSHNWSFGALNSNRETAAAVFSTGLATRLEMTFESLWRAGANVLGID